MAAMPRRFTPLARLLFPTDMAQPRLRPTFDVPLTDVAGFFTRLDTRLRTKGRDVGGWTHDRQAELQLEHDPHFFSPSLHVHPVTDGSGSRLQCRFAPLPQVWIVFIGIHFIVFLSGLAALMFGAVQLFLGRTPWGFALVPVAALVSAFVAGAAFIGQGLASDEMHRLRSFVERLAEETDRAPAPAQSDAQG